MKDIEQRLYDINISITLTEGARDFIVRNSFDKVYGARPIKRFVSRYVETLISKHILTEKIKPNTTVIIDIENDKLVIINDKQ